MDKQINTQPQPLDKKLADQSTQVQPQKLNPIPGVKKSPLVPFLISTIVILLGAGGFFAFQYFNSSPTPPTPSPNLSQTPSPTTTPITTPAPTENPYSDWLSYTDDQLGLTFKYPPTWDFHYLDNSAPSIMVAPKDIIEKIKNAPGGFGGGPFLTMVISLHDYEPINQTDELSSVVSKSATINSKAATLYTTTFLQDGPGFETGQVITDYVLQQNNKYLKISLLDPSQKSTLDQIVSLITISQ